MKFLQYGFVVVFVFFLFAFSVKSITAVRLGELRFQIQKEQIMKYELSSRTLREKLRNVFLEKDNLRSEIQLYILESDSMNSQWDSSDTERNFWEVSGSIISYIAGFFHFKTPQPLHLEKNTLMQLQTAFYYEKKRNFSEAEKAYRVLIEKLHPLSEETGFALLHRGFCLSMIGIREEAKKVLKKIVNDFPGTHYSDNAILLLGLIKKSEQKRAVYQKFLQTEQEMIDFYYRNGDYPEIIQMLSGRSDLSKYHQYVLARSREEVGQISDAVLGYIQLTKQTENQELARLANRRLLVLGNFILKSKSLQDFSEQNAIQTGDIESLAIVQEGKSKLKQEVFLEEEVLNEDKKVDSYLRALIQSSLYSPVSEKTESSISSHNLGEISLELNLQDGRTFYFQAIGRLEDKALIERKDFNITIPLGNLSSIRASGNFAKDPIQVEFESETMNAERIDFLGDQIAIISVETVEPRKFKWKEVKRISLRKF